MWAEFTRQQAGHPLPDTSTLWRAAAKVATMVDVAPVQLYLGAELASMHTTACLMEN